MRLRKEKPSPIFSTKKSTTLNLQTRPFASVESEESDAINIKNAPKGAQNHQSENLLQRLIDMPITESRSPIDVVQRKKRKHFSRIHSQREIASRQIQAKLNIGEPNDKYEKEADATAAKVVQQINTSPQGGSVQKEESLASEDDELQMKSAISKIQLQETMEDEDEELQTKSLVQRRDNLNGGEASTNLESSIQNARDGGQSLDPNLQAKIGQAMGADFSGVKIHTDAKSDQLNKSIQAKAFTTGQDVFFRQGAYEPSSRGGQELIAHELTHVVQQNGRTVPTASKVDKGVTANHIQRTKYDKEADGYYSQVLPGLKITDDNAVFTATSFKEKIGGGHSSIYIEAKEGDKILDVKIHLTQLEGNKVDINIENGLVARESGKRSWVKTKADYKAARIRARDLGFTPDQKYRYLGGSLTRGGMNCAKFAERILKAGGIKASSGLIIKTPSQLTRGGNKKLEYENSIAQDKERKGDQEKIDYSKIAEKVNSTYILEKGFKGVIPRSKDMVVEMSALKEVKISSVIEPNEAIIAYNDGNTLRNVLVNVYDLCKAIGRDKLN